jgi:hypothetical protein
MFEVLTACEFLASSRFKKVYTHFLLRVEKKKIAGHTIINDQYGNKFEVKISSEWFRIFLTTNH